MEFFDSHAHYNDEKFMEDREEILNQIYNESVTKLICAGYDVKSSIEAVKIANAHEFIYAIVGISPNDIPTCKNEAMENSISNNTIKLEINYDSNALNCEKNERKLSEQLEQEEFNKALNEQLEKIKNLAKQTKVVAIGEIGLDYYWNKENKKEQKLAFCKQIELANSLNLPIVIHTREAIYDTLDILKNKITPIKKGIFHCCPLNIDLIKEGLKLGFYISFAGPITFKNAKNAEDAIKVVPIEKILIETDSPYLAPEPIRGTRNDSRNVKYMAQKIAQVKGLKIEEVAKQTYQNAKEIFKIE